MDRRPTFQPPYRRHETAPRGPTVLQQEGREKTNISSNLSLSPRIRTIDPACKLPLKTPRLDALERFQVVAWNRVSKDYRHTYTCTIVEYRGSRINYFLHTFVQKYTWKKTSFIYML